MSLLYFKREKKRNVNMQQKDKEKRGQKRRKQMCNTI